jgi:hypothetical protein
MPLKDKEARKKYLEEYRKAHKNELKAYRDKYKDKNADKIRASQKKYLELHKEDEKYKASRTKAGKKWRELHYKEYYLKNKEKILLSSKLSSLRNRYNRDPEKHKEASKKKYIKWKNNNPDKYKMHRIQSNKKEVATLSNCYVKKLIKANSILSKHDISQEIVDTYRELMKLKRLIKKSKERNKNE